jgi:hypothetical protein
MPLHVSRTRDTCNSRHYTPIERKQLAVGPGRLTPTPAGRDPSCSSVTSWTMGGGVPAAPPPDAWRRGAVREPEVGRRRRPTPCATTTPSCRDNALDSFSSSSSSMTCRWTPAGAVCCDGLGPGWSGGWREAPPLGKALLALSPVRVIATSGPATEDPFEGSGPILRDRVRLQHMSGSRCRHLHLGTVAVEPATRQAAGDRRPQPLGGAV